MAIVCVLLQKQWIEAGHPTSAWILLISLMAATAATFTNGNGITAWPIVVAVALMASLPWRLIGVYIAAFACVASLYLVGYQTCGQHANLLSSIRQPLLLLVYVESILGGAVVPSSQNAWATQILGQVSLIVVVVLIFRLLRCRNRANVLDCALAGITLYCVATAFITSLGRVNFGTDQAFSPRYQTFALLFWFAITTWIIYIAVRQQATKSLVALYLLIAVIICSSANQYRRILEEVRHRIVEREVGGVAMITGVHDDNMLKAAIYSEIGEVWSVVEYLRTRRLSLFSTGLAAELGENVAQTYKVGSPDACRGYVDVISYVDTDPTAVRLQGWILDARTGRPPKHLLFVADGKIVGFGVSGYLRIDVGKQLRLRRAFHSGWMGYAKLQGANQTLSVYGLLDSSRNKDICQVGTVQVPADRSFQVQ